MEDHKQQEQKEQHLTEEELVETFKYLFAPAVNKGTNFVHFTQADIDEEPFTEVEQKFINKYCESYKLQNEDVVIIAFDPKELEQVFSGTEIMGIYSKYLEIYLEQQNEHIQPMMDLIDLYIKTKGKIRFAFWADPDSYTRDVIRDDLLFRNFYLTPENAISILRKYKSLITVMENYSPIEVPLNEQHIRDFVEQSQLDDSQAAFTITINFEEE